MKIYLTRHGQTNWNLEKKVMGKVNEPLNETGISQAKEVKDKLSDIKFDLIISSPLLRAKKTAEIICKDRNISIIEDDRISERNFGEMEGLKRSEFDFADFWDYHKNIKYDKAENIQDFFDRIYDFINDIKINYSDKNILIVTHGGVSIPFSCYFLETIKDGTLIEFVLENCEIKELEL